MQTHKIRLLLAYLIALTPTNQIRVFLYRHIFGYYIDQCKIGWSTVIVVDSAKFTKCQIGRNNKFVGPIKVIIKNDSIIGNNNIFNCGWWVRDEQFKKANYARSLEIGKNTLISNNHYFDVVGSFILADASWIAGRGSQFWTHGAGVVERNIYIGKHSYIGSAVRFAPGSSIGNNTLVGLGSVLTKEFNDENVIIAGQPATVLKKNYDWKTKENIEAEIKSKTLIGE